LVMLESNKSKNLTITVADPTQKLKVFKLTVSGNYSSKLSTYIKSTNQSELTIPLPQNEYAGSSFTVELKRR